MAAHGRLQVFHWRPSVSGGLPLGSIGLPVDFYGFSKGSHGRP